MSERVSDAELKEYIEHYRLMGVKAQKPLSLLVELQERRADDDVEEADSNAVAEMFHALERLCAAIKLYFEGGDDKREEALQEMYFGREKGEAAMQEWERNDA